ncbi:TlpA family protein disulfide reductase [Candidatus Woesearchaeota archaeon]|nr:TlpA family protein disulfide reductase [Candidatus Woesearchaeota archaeon]
MKKNTKHILLGIAVAAIIVAIVLIEKPYATSGIPQGQVLGVKKTPQTGIEIGAQAPNFILQDLDGKLIKLSDFRGEKVVVLNFWASWCPFCLDEMPDFEAVGKKHEDDAVILGVNRGEKKEIAFSYAKENLPVSVTYPILLDSNEDVSNVYILRGMPVTYFINKEGIITNRFFGKITKEIMEQEIKKALDS